MNIYTTYCTGEQTKKAVKLGAPIKEFIHVEPEFSMANGCLPYPEEIEMYEYPTTVQMIDWLETKGIHIYTHKIYSWSCHCYITFITVWETKNYSTIFHQEFFSNKEATFAAIDVALEYLSKNKK